MPRGEIDQGDLATYSEVCQLLHNAERREREAKRRLELVREAMVHANVTAANSATTRHFAIEATRGRRAWRRARS